ncbi:Hypothetical predicted protein [Cloeon dipterum]|uniref:Uncharacterized protein n=1 Tax=Cloeon dipterum TaxID=197152 RepID=A0A8S1CE00_9INSE|nr:Hypothetical predicted protein [Cloeon dipterum]
MKVALIIALCVAQGIASPIERPLEPEGDLNFPGFTRLNLALEDGLVDLAPGLARMPSRPDDDLAGCIATFFEEMAYSCYFYGKKELGENFMALKELAPDLEKLAVDNNVVPETWQFFISLRSEGLSVINLRTRLVDTMEVMEKQGADLITSIREQVNDLKSNKQELIAYKAAVKELAMEFEKQFSLQVSDSADILRLISYQLGDMGNNRDEVAEDMMAIFKAYNKLNRDAQNASISMRNEWKRIERGLIKIVGSAAVDPIKATVAELSALTKAEVTEVGANLLKTINDSRAAYAAMRVLFPGVKA